MIRSLTRRRFAAAGAAYMLTGASDVQERVVWYTSLETLTLNAVAQRFEQTHPNISLQPLRMEGNKIPARITIEQTAGKFSADVISADELPMEQLQEAGALQVFHPDVRDKFIVGSYDPNGYWTTLYYDTTVIAWNPQKVRADGLRAPTSLADLARPEWSGKIGIDASAFNWYAGVLATQSDARALLQRIAANRPLMTSGHTETVMQLSAGEFDVTPTAYGYMADHEQRRGRPVAFINPRPLIMTPTTISLAKNAPHADAARAFLSWILSREGQQFIVDRSGRNCARADIANNARVFSRNQPYYILPAPNRAQYNTLVSEFKALFGLGG